MRLSRPDAAADLRRGPFSVSSDATALRTHAFDPLAYGVALRDALFADPAALTAFAEVRAASLEAGRRLRVRLLLTPELQSLRWETLLDPRSGCQFALESDLLLTRYLDADDFQSVTLRPRGQLPALIAVAAPHDLAAYGLVVIDAPAEIAHVRAALTGIAVGVERPDENARRFPPSAS